MSKYSRRYQVEGKLRLTPTHSEATLAEDPPYGASGKWGDPPQPYWTSHIEICRYQSSYPLGDTFPALIPSSRVRVRVAASLCCEVSVCSPPGLRNRIDGRSEEILRRRGGTFPCSDDGGAPARGAAPPAFLPAFASGRSRPALGWRAITKLKHTVKGLGLET